MKKIYGLLAILSLMIILTSCSCKHENVKKATCSRPAKCLKCHEIIGEATNNHTWMEATCVSPEICTKCNLTKGQANGHTFTETTIVKESTCSESGIGRSVCSVCKETVDKKIPRKAHTPGEWEITLQATATTKGRRNQKCSVCESIIVIEEFEKSAAEIKSDYLLKCANYTYKEISRNPDNYKGAYAHFKGKIIQSIESGDSYTFRVNITKNYYSYIDTILVTYTKKESSESRLLEDDIVDIYGLLAGTHTYETVMGNEVTIPLLLAEYIELN